MNLPQNEPKERVIEQRKLLSMCSLRSFVAKILLELSDSSLLHHGEQEWPVTRSNRLATNHCPPATNSPLCLLCFLPLNQNNPLTFNGLQRLQCVQRELGLPDIGLGHFLT
jgi:hypothetical protein